jgi:hypothetical protein
LAHAVQLSVEIDAVKLQTLQLCGHAPHIERADATRAALLQLLRDLELLDLPASPLSARHEPLLPSTK